MWRSERIEQPKNLNHSRDFDLIIFNQTAGFENQNAERLRLRYRQRDRDRTREIEEQRDREKADNKSSEQTTG